MSRLPSIAACFQCRGTVPWLLVLLVLLLLPFLAQAQSIEWRQEHLVGGGIWGLVGVVATGDGGAVVVGTLERNISTRILLVPTVHRFDRHGQVVWVRTIDDSTDLVARDLRLLEGGTIIVGGERRHDSSDISRNHVAPWLAIIEPDGELRWSRMFNIEGAATGNVGLFYGGVTVRDDGVLMLFGQRHSPSATFSATVGSDGALRSSRMVASGEYPVGQMNMVRIDADRWLFMSARYLVPGSQSSATFIEVDGNGVKQSSRALDAPKLAGFQVNDIARTSDGSVLLAGMANGWNSVTRNVPQEVPATVLYDRDGRVRNVWTMPFGEVTSKAPSIRSLVPTSDGGFIGTYPSPNHLLKLDSLGRLLWKLPLAGWLGCHVVETEPGVYFAVTSIRMDGQITLTKVRE